MRCAWHCPPRNFKIIEWSHEFDCHRFLIVLSLTVIPAFAPPTWMVFSFLGFRFPDHPDWLLAITGTLAATLGRCPLAKMSRVIVRRRWLSDTSRDNVDALRDELSMRPKLTFDMLLLSAFTPLPSNSLVIAYGPTTMNMLRTRFGPRVRLPSRGDSNRMAGE